MKALITTLIALIFLFTAPAFAGKSGGAGKGRHVKKQIKTHRRLSLLSLFLSQNLTYFL